MLHVDLPSRARIERLASAQGEACVSIYLRTTPLTQDAQDDRIALKNLLKEAVTQLEARGVAKRAIWPIEEMVGALVDDDEFWATQANSLAIFATPERISTMRLANRIENSATAADRFFIKPLIRAVTFPQEAFVLAISTGAVRLIEVSADLPVHEVAVPGLPSGIEEALGRRKIVRKSGMVGGHAGSESAQIAAYGRIVDHALKPALAGQERSHRSTPMVARTVLQHALPTTFGLKAAGWLDMVTRHRQRLGEIGPRIHALQFGGAAGTLASLGGKGLQEGMSGENGVQAACLIHRRLERKDTDHQIENFRHARDARAVPGPNLRADVIKNLAGITPRPKGLGETQVEAGIVHQHHGIGFFRKDRPEVRLELAAEIAVVFENIPQANDCRALDPVVDSPLAQRSHPLPAGTSETDRGVQFEDGSHDLEGPRITAFLPGDKPEKKITHRVSGIPEPAAGFAPGKIRGGLATSPCLGWRRRSSRR
jgi:hypothetical protein